MLPYTETGAGDAVLVFLHFFGSSRREWRHVTERLSLRHRCVAADMPGFGDATGIRGYSVAEMAAHVCTLVEAFAPAPVTLIPHSFSAKPSMVVAAQPPANLQRLIMVAPTPLTPEPMTDDARQKMRVGNQTREGAEAFVEGSFHRNITDEDRRLAIEDVLRADKRAWLAWPDSGSLEDWSERITELRVPATLISGDQDQAIPLDYQRQHTMPLVEKTGGKLVVIEDAAHMLPNEAAAELTLAIEEAMQTKSQ